MSDPGHAETNRVLQRLEKEIRKIYKRAQLETQEKLDDYLRRFVIKDDIKREAVKRGELTQEQYAYWRKGQICIGERWKEMIDTLTTDMVNADKIAASIINNHTPEAYAINHNYATFQVEKGSLVDTSYTLYDRQTVERLIKGNPALLPKAKIDIPKDKRWNQKHIKAEILQGILQGEDIKKVSKRLQRVTDMDHSAAVRNARTIMTGAQNAGRIDSYKRAEEMGIHLQKEWLATLDGRTRHSHRQMDGIKVDNDKKFPNGCMYPGDPAGPPKEVYNCRCTLVAAVLGVDQSNTPRNSRLGSMTYEEWKEEHTPVAQKPDRQFIFIRKQLGDDFVDAMETMLNFSEHEDIRNLYYKFQEQLKVTDANNQGGAYFSPSTGGIHVNAKQIQQGDNCHQPFQTVFHEFAHNIDYTSTVGRTKYASREYKNGKLEKTIREDWKEFKIKFLKENRDAWAENDNSLRLLLREMHIAGVKFNGEGSWYDVVRQMRSGEITGEEVIKKYGDTMIRYFLGDKGSSESVDYDVVKMLRDENHKSHVTGSVSDIIEGIFCSRGDILRTYPLGVGHGAEYWYKTEYSKSGSKIKSSSHTQPLEFFAEVCDGAIANPESYQQMKRIFPKSVQMVHDIIKELTK